ncbi:hypothetical protein H4582DRAFT_2189481 [Lactarius indigo]|nr:hypothetical protein H4582DRAFT_2189481 [Lactarius indigo]
MSFRTARVRRDNEAAVWNSLSTQSQTILHVDRLPVGDYRLDAASWHERENPTSYSIRALSDRGNVATIARHASRVYSKTYGNDRTEKDRNGTSLVCSDRHWAEVILWAEKKWENRVGDEVMSQNRNAVGTRTRPHAWLREKRSSRNVLENQSHETSTVEFEQKLDLDYSAGPDFAFLGVNVDVGKRRFSNTRDDDAAAVRVAERF